jgi:hypothetical protein
MSSPLALAAVTGVLQYMLNLVYNDPVTGIGSVSVTAVAPDIVQSSLGTNGDSKLRVNLFLHQVTPNAAWRNLGRPSLDTDGATRLKNPPLALDLHYLLTAYAGADTEAEALLGYAILMLHEYPTISRSDISTALGAIPNTNPLSAILSGSNLASQLEMIKITPATLGREELAWLWTALKADYRPTFPFRVSVVLIQPQNSTSYALPVITPKITVQAGPSPTLIQAQGPLGQTAAPGDLVTVTGESLAGITRVALSSQRLGIQYPPFKPASVTNDSITFTVPENPAALPAGSCTLVGQITDSGGNVLQSTNSLPMPIAAKILLAAPAPTITGTAQQTTVQLNCDPQVRPNQTVALIMGGTSVAAQPLTTVGAALTFQFSPPLASGNYIARLQVDGVTGPVSFTTSPPAITGPQVKVP